MQIQGLPDLVRCVQLSNTRKDDGKKRARAVADLTTEWTALFRLTTFFHNLFLINRPD